MNLQDWDDGYSTAQNTQQLYACSAATVPLIII